VKKTPGDGARRMQEDGHEEEARVVVFAGVALRVGAKSSGHLALEINSGRCAIKKRQILMDYLGTILDNPTLGVFLEKPSHVIK
jgi:hypothetical protein